MIDNLNQEEVYGVNYPKDRVKGYSIKQLENGLKGARSWNQWKNNIKNRYAFFTPKEISIENNDYFEVRLPMLSA